ncbi:MAG: PDZ domain-containing protein [Frankiaceae bacterium]|nr:PDZ domain-containing protein [Arenimonas sp.]
MHFPHSSLRPALLALALGLVAASPALADEARPSPADGNRIAAARDRVLPVVVSILTVRQDYRQGEPSLSVSSGSGTVVSEFGHIATNAHVTQNGKSFRVVFADGRELPARLVGTDTLSDLAVLQVQPATPEKFAFAQFADKLDLRPGDTVLAMGAPWGLSNSMSAGVVNNPRRLLVSLFDDEAEYEDSLSEDEPTGRYYAWIQHDASIAPGNSGGPLVDLSGRIVGVNTRGMIVGGDLAFAIPGAEAGRIVKALIEIGKVPRVSLGFRLRSLKGTPYTQGVLVNAVERGSPPEKAGLQAGDRIISINGNPITALQPIDVPEVQQSIAELPIDSTVALQLMRDGKQREIKLKALAQATERGKESALAAYGMSASELTPAMGKRRNIQAESGVLVTGVRPGGPAAVARPEIQAGVVVSAINGKPVATLDDLLRQATTATDTKPLVLQIESNGSQRLSLLKPVFGDQSREPLPELPQSWVGVEVQPFTGTLAKDIGLPSAGYRISRLYPGSPLARQGARVGDLLTAIDDDPLKPANDISSEGFDLRVHDLSVGTSARFTAMRDGKPLQFSLAVLPSPVETSGLRTLASGRLRAQLRELGFYDRVNLRLPSERQGVYIDGVESGGAAGLAHLKRGDVITHLGNQAIGTPVQLSKALETALASAGDNLIPLQVIRGTQTRILFLERYWLNADAPESP